MGGRLLRALREEGRAVRCLVRRPDALAARGDDDFEVVVGDVLDPDTLTDALRGIDAAFYLVHSMGAGPEFREKDRRAARNFAVAAKAAGVRRVVYLGGLGVGDDLSEHLESRHETGHILREEGPPTVELRASIVIGSGSLSFEMVRALVDRLPVMITPRFGGVRFGSRLVDSRTVTVDVPASAAFAPVRRIGGDTGWYFGNWLWRIRGLMDSLTGGVGLRRGRRDPEHLAPGDTVDFWRVEAVEENHLLRLSAEMLLPGRAWLQFEVEERDGRSVIRQTALFDPVGLSGLLYWYSLFPAHELIFAGMLRNLAKAAVGTGEILAAGTGNP